MRPRRGARSASSSSTRPTTRWLAGRSATCSAPTAGFADAARQYETLARLAPDDASVPLLRAAAAEGLGKLESALKWAELAGSSAAPGSAQSLSATARGLAATYLAWGRLDAATAGRAGEVSALDARLARVRSGELAPARLRARVTLTWCHPELHPALWTTALGAPMPAPEGDAALGFEQAVVAVKEGLVLEVRLDPDEVEHAARLGAVATLTVVFDEGEPGAEVVRLPITFARTETSGRRRLALEGRRLRRLPAQRGGSRP